MKTSKIAVTLLLSSLLLAGCGLKSNQAIIKINDGVITQKAFDEIMDQQLAQSPFAKIAGGDLKGNKDGFLYLMTEQRVVNQLIIQEILNQEADARGIKVTNKDVDEEIKKIMDQLGGRDQLAKILKENGVSIGEFKKDVKNQVRMRKLADSASDTSVSEKECKDFYNKNIKKFKHGDQVRAAHILIAANPNQLGQEMASDPKSKLTEEEIKASVEKIMAEKKALADKIAKELEANSSKFPEYAKKYSQDPGSAERGGDLGFFEKDKMVPEFSNAVFAAKPNSAPAVVQTQFGYHIYIVTDRKEAGTVPFEKVQADIQQFLTNQKQMKSLDDITTAAKKKSTIEFIDDSYNPETIDKKLKNQLNDISGGAKDKFDSDKKQEAKK